MGFKPWRRADPLCALAVENIVDVFNLTPGNIIALAARKRLLTRVQHNDWKPFDEEAVAHESRFLSDGDGDIGHQLDDLDTGTQSYESRYCSDDSDERRQSTSKSKKKEKQKGLTPKKQKKQQKKQGKATDKTKQTGMQHKLKGKKSKNKRSPQPPKLNRNPALELTTHGNFRLWFIECNICKGLLFID